MEGEKGERTEGETRAPWLSRHHEKWKLLMKEKRGECHSVQQTVSTVMNWVLRDMGLLEDLEAQ